MFVYFAINSVNLKMYIGKSVEPEVRWVHHVTAAMREDDDFAFHRAIRKYGMDAFEFDILETCSTEQESLTRETFWIKTYDTLLEGGWGYNMTLGGDGCRCTGEVEERRLEALRTALRTPENRKRQSELTSSYWQDPVYREKVIRLAAEAQRRPEVREKQSKALKERWEDPEQKELLMKGVVKSHTDPESLAKRIKSLTATINTDEAKQMRGCITKKLWEDPEYRSKTSAAIKIAQNTPEAKSRNRELLRTRYETPERLAINAKIIELYINNISPKEIAKVAGCHLGTVYRHINKYNEKN